MPDPGELYPQVQVSTYQNWDAFANWWWSMIRDQHVAAPEIQQKVAELTAGKETRFDKIRAIYDFVTTGITYQAWPFGPHGYKPYTTRATLLEGQRYDFGPITLEQDETPSGGGTVIIPSEDE